MNSIAFSKLLKPITMRTCFFTLVCLFTLSNVFCQNTDFQPFSKLATGASLTYIWDPNPQNLRPPLDYTYHENTVNLNLATNILPRVDVGMSGMKIFTSSDFSGKNDYFLAGAFGQYAVVNTSRERLYFELGSFWGNYCTCGTTDPYQLGTLTYLDLGIGYTPRIWKNFYLDLGFNVYEIMNKVEAKYSYTQYVVGVEYHLGR